MTYDLSRPLGQRVVSLQRNAAPVLDTDRLRVAAPGFLAEGGDLYTMFAESDAIANAGKVSDVVAAYFAQRDEVGVPSRQRQIEVGPTSPQ